MKIKQIKNSKYFESYLVLGKNDTPINQILSDCYKKEYSTRTAPSGYCFALSVLFGKELLACNACNYQEVHETGSTFFTNIFNKEAVVSDVVGLTKSFQSIQRVQNTISQNQLDIPLNTVGLKSKDLEIYPKVDMGSIIDKCISDQILGFPMLFCYNHQDQQNKSEGHVLLLGCFKNADSTYNWYIFDTMFSTFLVSAQKNIATEAKAWDSQKATIKNFTLKNELALKEPFNIQYCSLEETTGSSCRI
ncbi:MAG: hypothetical protein LKE40_09240 [Spirochaetia bacterium]|jgi:hypothetical protein|nr:hypothetical protein [Spirochaetia bacterium]